ncbi:hypothetical protein [Actinophytocola gossypii]|uniref:Uncharacterized protein n=1 Tax=Actinophytocola gossypii TaxID=2812003 RepID=A0ABT2JHZ2_9PSEU|nr:hypothetical protein [Actinophytocola gossypii]MCT2587505.1 hypothetical protein [Actinophytocola gossypii]
MNEHEFRDALRTNMSATPEPPPMNEGPVLDAARRDRRRRRAMWAGGGSAAAVVAIAVGVAVLVPSGSGDAPGLNVAAGQPSVSVTQTTEAPSSAVSTEETEPSWPNGQTDRTATEGPEYDAGMTVLTELEAAVPAGYETPDDLVGTGDLAGSPMRTHQANYDDTFDGVEVWTYSADVALTKGDGVGRLSAAVRTPGGPGVGEGCDMPPYWGGMGDCTEVLVDGKRVAVVTVPPGGRDQFDQWAGYRHEDGTLVYVGQAADRAFTNFPALDGLPFTAEQLAALAADPRFHLD